MANKNCLDCHGTGKIKLLVSTVICKCKKTTSDISSETFNYADAIAEVNRKWDDACCSCHISPPCGFCLRYADADLSDPEYCYLCGDPYPNDQLLLHKCLQCDQYVCDVCYGGIDTACADCG